jgi:hypothetical protein
MTYYDVDKFFAKNPTKICASSWGVWYEHPTKGDEVGHVFISCGVAIQTDIYDFPTMDESAYWKREIEKVL